jgi:hypothetical protein
MSAPGLEREGLEFSNSYRSRLIGSLERKVMLLGALETNNSEFGYD